MEPHLSLGWRNRKLVYRPCGMRSLTLCQLLRSNNAAGAHLVRGSVDRRGTAPAVAIYASATLIAAIVTASTPTAVHAISSLSIAATVALTLLMRTLRIRLDGLKTLLGLLAAFLLATVLTVASTLSVFASAVAATLLLLLLPLRRGFPAGYQFNQLSDKSKSHLGFL
jgi:hypothetical protein